MERCPERVNVREKIEHGAANFIDNNDSVFILLGNPKQMLKIQWFRDGAC